MILERWRPVVGWEDLYAVSDRGRVQSLRKQIILSLQRRDEDGYLFVTLCRNGVKRVRRVHHLVLEAFVGPCPPGMQCCHRDDDPENNALWNLRWDTPKGNGADRERNNTQCPAGHDYTELNTYEFVRKDGRREKHCRQCRRERWAAKHGKTGRQNRSKYRA